VISNYFVKQEKTGMPNWKTI